MIPKPYPRFSPDARMLDLLNRNPSLLLLLEHFGMDFTVGDQTVELLCSSSGVDRAAFIAIGNLYNGYFPAREDLDGIRDISSIILCMKNKYPELKEQLLLLHQRHQSNDIVLLEQFFQDYFQEVLDHLAYEEEVAFPYFHSLVNTADFPSGSHYRVSDYREHHTDIETKLADLKNLLLKHIKIEGFLLIPDLIQSRQHHLEAMVGIPAGYVVQTPGPMNRIVFFGLHQQACQSLNHYG